MLPSSRRRVFEYSITGRTSGLDSFNVSETRPASLYEARLNVARLNEDVQL